MKAIEGSPKSLKEIFNNNEFEIPEFQRPYSWGIDECDQLWEDFSSILNGEHDPKGQYFLGSIVVYPKPKDDKKILCVIDGQQRLTTLLMLFYVLFQKAKTLTILEKLIYKIDPRTGDAIIGTPKINSCVFMQKDKERLVNVLEKKELGSNKDDKFENNCHRLSNLIEEWSSKMPAKKYERAIESLLDNVVMLPIKCEDQDDALTLFQVINDRGRPLSDSDIFKAKMYNATEDKDDFIARWNELSNHEKLFRYYMHISRSKKDDTNKEIGLRRYIVDNHMKNTKELSKSFESIMTALETSNWAEENNGNIDEIGKIYWKLLSIYPNEYCYYPLQVFLCKHMKRSQEGFSLPKDKGKEYFTLLEDTVRYFFLKGLIYNSLNYVKFTTFKVCSAIEHGQDFISEYKKDIEKGENDRFKFKEVLKRTSYGQGRYGRCFVFLCAYLNKNQNKKDFLEVLSQQSRNKGGLSLHVEHILPVQWNHYDKWDEESHKKYIDNIGNLVPLERKFNSKASNEFFSRKKQAYTESKIQDVLDLSEKQSIGWYKEDIEERQKELNGRLLNFFSPIMS